MDYGSIEENRTDMEERKLVGWKESVGTSDRELSTKY